MSTAQPSLKYDHVYAIIRWDKYLESITSPLSNCFTVKKIVWTEEEAQAEVDRLNQLNGDKGSDYFYQVTRLERTQVLQHDVTGEAESSSRTE